MEVLWWVLCVCVCVCVCDCPRGYLRNQTRHLYQFLCTLPMAVARSSSGRVTKSQGKGSIFVGFCSTDNALYSIGREVGWACTLQVKSDIYDCLVACELYLWLAPSTMRYITSGLWMTSCFHKIMDGIGPNQRRPSSSLFGRDRQVAELGWKSADPTASCLLLAKTEKSNIVTDCMQLFATRLREYDTANEGEHWRVKRAGQSHSENHSGD